MCVCVSPTVSAGTDVNVWTWCIVHLYVSTGLGTHTVCMCCLSVSMSELVVLCFFSTSIFRVSLYQTVMGNKQTVDDRLMVMLMPLPPS